ncbi:hypothetical protein KM043_002154 [Ampulex compressa]|nr:hypothetical protein KM043_002154 [Ampulex compressa]
MSRKGRKEEESRAPCLLTVRHAGTERYTSMAHMDLGMFAGRVEQILIKRNIFRMRALASGETRRGDRERMKGRKKGGGVGGAVGIRVVSSPASGRTPMRAPPIRERRLMIAGDGGSSK